MLMENKLFHLLAVMSTAAVNVVHVCSWFYLSEGSEEQTQVTRLALPSLLPAEPSR